MPSPTERSFTKRAPLIPPLVSPSRRHPTGGIENEIFSPLQSNVSRGWSLAGPGGAELELLELHAGPPMRMSSTNERPVARLPARIRSCIGIGRQRPEARPLNQRILVDSTKVWLGDPSRISTRILTSMPASTGIERGLPR